MVKSLEILRGTGERSLEMQESDGKQLFFNGIPISAPEAEVLCDISQPERQYRRKRRQAENRKPNKRLRIRGQGRIRVEVHRAILRLRRVRPGLEDAHNLLAALEKLENVEASLVAGRWTKVLRKEQ